MPRPTTLQPRCAHIGAAGHRADHGVPVGEDVLDPPPPDDEEHPDLRLLHRPGCVGQRRRRLDRDDVRDHDIPDHPSDRRVLATP